MRKSGIIIIVALILLTLLGWWGYSFIRWGQILDSGRPVLLINKDAGSFAYSNNLDRDDIDRSYKIKGYLDELSEQEIDRLVSGLNYETSVNAENFVATRVQLPDGEEGQKWFAAVSSLSEPQQALCQEFVASGGFVYCQASHLTLNAMIKGQDGAVCDAIFHEVYSQNCRQDLQSKDNTNYRDTDNNQLIDYFENSDERNA